MVSIGAGSGSRFRLVRVSGSLPALLRRILPLGLFAGLIAMVSATRSYGADTLSLEQCIAMARDRSPELRIAQNAIHEAALNRQISSKSRWPRMSLVGNAGYAPVSLDFGYDPAVSNGGELGLRVVAEQTLYAGGQFGLQMKQAEAETAQHTLALQQEERDLEFSVREAFIAVLAAMRIRELHIESVAQLSAYTSRVASLSQGGAAATTDMLNAKVELAKARIDSSTAEADLASAQQGLARLLGIPADAQVIVSGSLAYLLIDVSDSTPVLTESLVANSLDIEAARLDSVQSQLDLSMTRAQWKPRVALTADAGVVTSRENLLLPSPERYNSGGYSVGVSVEMPLWGWGTKKTELAKGFSRLRSAHDHIAAVRRDQASALTDTRLRLANSLSRIGAVRQTARTAQDAYLLTLAQHADGYAPAAAVLLAQQTLTDTRKTEIETLSEIQLLKARLDQLTQTGQETLP